MASSFSWGTELGPQDLHIFFRDQNGNLFDPASVTFSIYDTGTVNAKGTVVPILVPPGDQTATRVGPGEYYADWTVPNGIRLGSYEIRWSWLTTANDWATQKTEPFSVAQPNLGKVVSHEPGKFTVNELIKQLDVQRKAALIPQYQPNPACACHQTPCICPPPCDAPCEPEPCHPNEGPPQPTVPWPFGDFLGSGSVTFPWGKELGPKDLHIFFKDQNGNFFDPNSVTYSIYDVTDFEPILVPPADQQAVRSGPGQYYAGWTVPQDIRLGPYEIGWTWIAQPGANPAQNAKPFTVAESNLGEVIRRERLPKRPPARRPIPYPDHSGKQGPPGPPGPQGPQGPIGPSGPSGNTAIEGEDATNELRIVSVDNDGRVRLGQEWILFYDPTDGSAINTNLWTQSGFGMVQSQIPTTGLCLNSGSDVVLGDYSVLQSSKQFQIFNGTEIFVKFRSSVISQSGAFSELGFGIPSAAAPQPPTNGVFFRWVGNALYGIINFGGMETSVELIPAPHTSINPVDYYDYEIYIYEGFVNFSVSSYQSSYIIDQNIPFPPSNGAATSVSHVPVFARIWNTGPLTSAAQIFIKTTNVEQADIFLNKSYEDTAATLQRGSITDPTTFLQTTQFANSAEPTTAVLSNTIPSYTTLGGLYQFASVAGSPTDYALFAYQVPTGYQLHITNVLINSFIVGSQSSTIPNLIQWGLGLNSSGASLATGGPNPPRRLVIGMQSAPKTANVGDSLAPQILSYEPKTPLITDSGKYLIVIMRMLLGRLTPGQM